MEKNKRVRRNSAEYMKDKYNLSGVLSFLYDNHKIDVPRHNVVDNMSCFVIKTNTGDMSIFFSKSTAILNCICSMNSTDKKIVLTIDKEKRRSYIRESFMYLMYFYIFLFLFFIYINRTPIIAFVQSKWKI